MDRAFLQKLHTIERVGEVEESTGLIVGAKGPPQVFVGELCYIRNKSRLAITSAEVLGFQGGRVWLMPFTKANIRTGDEVVATGEPCTVELSNALLGNMVDAFAVPFKPCFSPTTRMPIYGLPIHPLERLGIQESMETKIAVIDTLIPLGRGQRVGIFAGSGVGKSTLLSHMTQEIDSDVNVIALIGERGREVQAFWQALSEKTRKKSVMVVACSDAYPLLRRQALFTALTIAEFFCSQKKHVVLFVDSITRFAFAQREISIGAKELPSNNGFPATIFTLLPTIVERAGLFRGKGSISAIYTVLMEEEHACPIADCMRSLLDGHIVLDKARAERGYFPPIDILKSLSRLAPYLYTPEEQKLAEQVRSILHYASQYQDLVTLSVYKTGQNVSLDDALVKKEALEQQIFASKEPKKILFQQIKEILQ